MVLENSFMNTLGPYLCSQMLFENLGILVFRYGPKDSPAFVVLGQDRVGIVYFHRSLEVWQGVRNIKEDIWP